MARPVHYSHPQQHRPPQPLGWGRRRLLLRRDGLQRPLVRHRALSGGVVGLRPAGAGSGRTHWPIRCCGAGAGAPVAGVYYGRCCRGALGLRVETSGSELSMSSAVFFYRVNIENRREAEWGVQRRGRKGRFCRPGAHCRRTAWRAGVGDSSVVGGSSAPWQRRGALFSLEKKDEEGSR